MDCIFRWQLCEIFSPFWIKLFLLLGVTVFTTTFWMQSTFNFHIYFIYPVNIIHAVFTHLFTIILYILTHIVLSLYVICKYCVFIYYISFIREEDRTGYDRVRQLQTAVDILLHWFTEFQLFLTRFACVRSSSLLDDHFSFFNEDFFHDFRNIGLN